MIKLLTILCKTNPNNSQSLFKGVKISGTRYVIISNINEKIKNEEKNSLL